MVGLHGTSEDAPAVVQRLSREILDALKDPGVQSRLTKIGAIVEPQPAEGCDAFLRVETRRWAEIIQAAGISYE